MTVRGLFLTVLFFAIPFSALASLAQNIYGFTSLDYDEDANTVIADCETDIDYISMAYYTVDVGCSIVDNSHTQVAYGSATDYGHDGWVQVLVEANASPDVQYTATGRHNATVEYYDYDPGFGGRCAYNCYDVFNFLSFTDQNIDAEDYVDFLGPGPFQYSNRQRLHAGNTHQTATPTAPTKIKVKTWCVGGLNGSGTTGATLEYWVLNSSGGISKQGWYVVEQQTDSALTSDTTFGPGTSYRRDTSNIGDKFEDDIGDFRNQPHTSTQTFFVTAATSGKPHHPLTIAWFGPVDRNSNDIPISSVNIVSINGETTPSSCRYQ
jgi:hypothetical protein